jgi:site-specific recombinase XerD
VIASRFPALLQGFFTDRLLRQKMASSHTIASYRDTFRLLLHFAMERRGKAPSLLTIEDLDATFIGEFLDHIETVRGNSARTRNVRLAAVHSFFQYVAWTEPAHALHCQRILAIPNKRYERRVIEFLTFEEVEALLAAPDVSRWIGRRDRMLILLAAQTGLRVSELTALRPADIVFGTGAHVRCEGKGRKFRCTPLRSEVCESLPAWLAERAALPGDTVFPSAQGRPLHTDAVGRLVAKHAAAAQRACPTLTGRRITPHVLRHSSAMDFLGKGIDLTTIAIWLGHESVETTRIYLHADLRLKERALAHTTPHGGEPGRFRPDDSLLAFLEGL